MLSIMKKYILGLFVWIIWLINFWYCSTVEDLIQVFDSSNDYNISSDYQTLYHLSSSDYWVYCIKANRVSWWTFFNFWYSSRENFINWWDYMTVYLSTNSYHIACFYINQPYVWVWIMPWNQYSQELNISYELFRLDELLAENLPIMTKWECQVEYNLIPVENVDQHYCETNDLCPEQNECVWSWGVSELFINNISHIWAPLINITIPEEFEWDYTWNDEEFDLNVIWYNVDTEYIDWIIRTQNYKPTSEDFTQLVWMLAPYSKYLLFLLFVFIIWAWIKKPFKSKKL